MTGGAAHTDPPVPADEARERWQDAVCLDDIERIAAAELPTAVRDFVAGGSGAELTLAANRAALDRVHLLPRVLRDVSRCRSSTTLLGRAVSMPVVVAPMGYHRLVHPDGEIAAAKAATQAGVPFAAAMLSSRPVEQISGTGAETWFQLYWLRDGEESLRLVRRAEEAGCTAIVLTVDVPWMGRRLRDVRNQFALPADVIAANLTESAGTAAHRTGSGDSALVAHTREAFSSAVSWAELERLRAFTRLPLVVKGVLDPADARRAEECGADAVVVSNHGGRQLDGAVPSIDALHPVRLAVGPGCQVLFDSGIRSGLDILRALALGADGVLVGRPVLWGLAAGGAAGAEHVLRLLATELHTALGLAGCASVADAARLGTVGTPAQPRQTAPEHEENDHR
ncbi:MULTISPECIES: alpha-hydroxy acid oxidase [unclassified Streptomyces]|uniref:alpha-hydroxy acid oxidase n=1 Tax=unclassified Streptomyces TaxID=2593676 RepID=UPI0036DFDA41